MNLHKCLQSFLNTLGPLVNRWICGIPNVEICKSGYKVNNTFPTEGWEPYDPAVVLSGDDAHFWMRASIHTPAVEADEDLVLHINFGPNSYNSQGLLYLNGIMTQGLDANHPDTPLEPDTDYVLHNYYHIGTFQGGTAQCRMSVCAVNRLVEQLYYDVKVPFEACPIPVSILSAGLSA